MYERILVPLDGSKLAELALPYAQHLAARLGSALTLLAISLSEEAGPYYEHEIYIDRAVEVARTAMEELADKLGRERVPIERSLVVGHPAEEIVRYADQGADLVVMASHGRSGLTRWALGSVADKVVRASSKPVILIRAEGAVPDVRTQGLDNILVALDGSQQSEAVLPAVEELASPLGAAVTLVQVVVPQHFVAVGEYAAPVPYADEEIASIKAGAERYLQYTAARLRDSGISATTLVRVGTPAQEIIDYADEVRAGLVAMATHGHSGVTRWAFGSVADRVLHGGHAPLLLVRTPASGS
ncbi:MAG: universal stress protein [Chloroflexota bacterium]